MEAPVQEPLSNIRAEAMAEPFSKLRCTYRPYECVQLALEGHKYCKKHILQDKNAPYRQCTYVYPSNGKRCPQPTPKSDKKEHSYCSEHGLKVMLTRCKEKAKGPPPNTPEAILNSLSHYIKTTGAQQDDKGLEPRVTRSNDPFDNKIYVYLDFGGKLTRDSVESPVFFRVANLHKANPLVQVNNDIYKGTYDQAVGINLFFTISTEHNLEGDAFRWSGPITLDYLLSNYKVINLKLSRISPKTPDLPAGKKKIEYNFNWDYETLLKKFEDGSLKLEDLVKKVVEAEEESVPGQDNDSVMDEVKEKGDEIEEPVPEVEMKEIEPEETPQLTQQTNTTIKDNYLKLRKLALRPVKRARIPERVEICEPKYSKAFEYHNLERQVLSPSDAFRDRQADEDQYIDIERCVLYGLLTPSTESPRCLTVQELRKVLLIDNFDNLSLYGRLLVLERHVEALEKSIDGLPDERDEFDRTPKETLEIYRKLRDALRRRVKEIVDSRDS